MKLILIRWFDSLKWYFFQPNLNKISRLIRLRIKTTRKMRFLRRFICQPCNWCSFNSKQISFDAVMPLLLLPLLTLIASQNLLCTIFVFIMTPLLVYYLYRNFLRFQMRTKFFLMWTVASILLLMLVFEFMVIPQLEILPEENLVFMICFVSGIICWYKTVQNADQPIQEVDQENEQLLGLELGEGSRDTCNICRKRAPPKAFHCKICQTCIMERQYHCKWLDCCIGIRNLYWYLGCLFFSTVAFMYGSNLSLTTICHPFIFSSLILLPDDCSDVYNQLDTGICFVLAVYSLLIGLVILFYLIKHLWLLYLGKTFNERSLLRMENQHNEELLRNAIQLLCCK